MALPERIDLGIDEDPGFFWGRVGVLESFFFRLHPDQFEKHGTEKSEI